MKLKWMLFTLLAFVFSLASVALAGGPTEVAKADFEAWPKPFANHRDFDLASRAEILISTLVVQDFEKSGVTKEELGIKSLNEDSLAKWKTEFKARWVAAFKDAAKTCDKSEKDFACKFKGKDFSDLAKYASEQDGEMKKQFAKWYENSQSFYKIYMKEQYRLAGLFPKPTSEILLLDSKEVTGDEFKDGEFLLTLDDGPTAAKGTQTSDTDAYAKLLNDQKIHGFFFALGNALEFRLKSTSLEAMKNLYKGQCLASHGYAHQSHQKWDEWKSSLEKTAAIIQQIVPDTKSVHFRPPYGQRTTEIVNFLSEKSAKVIQWNIDSQDWHAKMLVSDVGSRVKKLMLLKRKGIILFHDVHKKGLTAIPELIDFAKKSTLTWVDCKSI